VGRDWPIGFWGMSWALANQRGPPAIMLLMESRLNILIIYLILVLLVF
jgi:hypothetical protein